MMENGRYPTLVAEPGPVQPARLHFFTGTALPRSAVMTRLLFAMTIDELQHSAASASLRH